MLAARKEEEVKQYIGFLSGLALTCAAALLTTLAIRAARIQISNEAAWISSSISAAILLSKRKTTY